MSENSLLVLIEAGQVRSLAGLAFQLPLPDALIWGPEVLPRIESVTEETDVWPTERQLASAVVLDRNERRLILAGGSHTFDTPYQMVMFDRMLSAAWGYDVEHVALRSEAIAEAAGIEPLPTDADYSRRMMAATIGVDDDLEDDEEDDEYFADEGDDFRQLTTRTVANRRDSFMQEYDDQNWFVSIRAAGEERFRHYLGDFVLQTFADGGPDVISNLTQLHEVDVPKEGRATRGAVVDIEPRTLSLWAHPRGVAGWDELNQAWPDWTIDRWVTNGYRRQLELTGEVDWIVTPSDLQVLSGFVPDLVEQIDLQEMMGQIKSGVRGLVIRGFGCLAVVLAVPALIAAAVTGGWKGPFAFAATLWVIAYVGYLMVVGKLKRNFAALAEQRENAEAMLPKLAPQEKQERIRIVDQALEAAGFPDFEQIQACAERYDEDDDDDESIDPIVSA